MRQIRTGSVILFAAAATALAGADERLRGQVSLEGWAFDAERSAQAAARAVASDPAAVRILRPVVESSVSSRFEPAIRTEANAMKQGRRVE